MGISNASCAQAIRQDDLAELNRRPNQVTAEALSLLLQARPSLSEIVIISWNARWIVDPHSGPSASKRELISRLLSKGYIVCLQETHWLAEDAALWQHGLLLRNVFWSAAQSLDGPNHLTGETNDGTDRRCGGVATLLPARYDFVLDECYELVPGFGIYTTIRTPRNEVIRIGNIYLQPGNQDEIWHRAALLLPANAAEDPASLIVGDLNTELGVPAPAPGSLLHEITQD